MNEFKKAIDVLKAMEKVQNILKTDLFKCCDWDNESDVAEHKKDEYTKKRKRLLDKIIPDRKCPRCSELLLENNQWVVNKIRTRAICRSCFSKGFTAIAFDSQEAKFVAEIFKNVQLRYDIDGKNLMDAREALGISRKRFAYWAGWSYTYQYRLEVGEVMSIGYDAVRKIVFAFDRCRVIGSNQ